MKIFNLTTWLTLCMLLAISADAQKRSDKVDILWGDEFKDSKLANQLDVIGFDEKAMYTLKDVGKRQLVSTPFSRPKSTYAIESFDKKMNFKNSRKLEFSKKDKTEFEFVKYFNDQIHLFYSKKDKDKKKFVLYSSIVNKSTLTPSKKKTQILSMSYEKRAVPSFGYDISRDSSKMLVWATLSEVKGEEQEIAFTVLEKNGEKLWSKTVTVPYKSELFNIVDLQVNNEGKVFVLGLEFDKLSGLIFKGKRKKIKDGKANYSYQILTYFDDEKFDQIPVELTDYYITALQIDISNEKELVCAGFYSEKGTFSMKGSCYLKIDIASHKVLKENTMEFDADFITQNMRGREAKKTKRKLEKGKDVEMPKYRFRDLVLRDDGGAVLVGEQYYVVVHTTTDGRGNMRTTYTYHYNDIIVVNINPEGVIDWAQKIPKRQVSSSPASHSWYTSYVMSVTGSNLYFIFNDDPRNLMVKSGDKIHSFNRIKEATAVLVGIDSKGKQTREFLFDRDDVNTVIRPLTCEQISKREVAIYSQRKKKHQFAKLTFK